MRLHALLLFLMACLCASPGFAQEPADSLSQDSTFIQAVNQTSLSKFRKKEIIKAYLKGKIDDLNNVDTAWISPNYYNWAFMIQNTNTFEHFTVRGDGSANINSLEFAPGPTYRLGAYFGWRWLFLGYTFNVKDIFNGKRHGSTNTEVDLSLYTSKIGVDLYYRRTGNNFKINNIGGRLPQDSESFDPTFNGLNIHIKGLNVYYIFNHRKFSFPAAFSQSTEQRRSCGSFKLGFSYSIHKVNFDHTLLPQVVQENISEAMKFRTVHYSDYNISFGYSYNWVFKHNYLLGVSLTPALAYTHSELEGEQTSFIGGLQFHNLNIDVIARVGLVYNNTKYFAGLSFITHSFNYKKDQFSITNSFASLNFYVGLNFLRKKEYRN